MEEKKITLDEFWGADTLLGIHCDSEEKAKMLLTAFDNMGKRDRYGQRYPKSDIKGWYGYETDGVFLNNGGDTFCCLTKKERVLTFKFEDVDLQDYLTKKYPLSVDDFWDAKEQIFIHCKTEDQAKTLLNVFDKMGKCWWNNKSYIEKTMWHYFGVETAYNNKGEVADVFYARRHNAPIYRFAEVDLTKYLDNDNQNEQEKGE